MSMPAAPLATSCWDPPSEVPPDLLNSLDASEMAIPICLRTATSAKYRMVAGREDGLAICDCPFFPPDEDELPVNIFMACIAAAMPIESVDMDDPPPLLLLLPYAWAWAWVALFCGVRGIREEARRRRKGTMVNEAAGGGSGIDGGRGTDLVDRLLGGVRVVGESVLGERERRGEASEGQRGQSVGLEAA